MSTFDYKQEFSLSLVGTEKGRIIKRIEHDFEGTTLDDDILPHIEEFLLGCGFKFNGRLTIVEDKDER